jgi:hypothetical protein
MPPKKTPDPAKEKLQTRANEIVALTAEFCRQHLDREYAQLCEKLIGKMSRKRAVPFAAGRSEIWAGAVIYALGQVNFLFDKKRPPHVTQADVAEHFGTTTSTLGQKAKVLRDLFKMRHWDPEFSTRKMAARNPLAGLAMVNGLIVPISMLEELSIRYPDKG